MLFKILIALALVGCTKGRSSNVSRPDDKEIGETDSPTLIGGREADPKEWPASVYARMGGSACTATVVGPEVLIIASHCVSHGGSATFSIGPNNYSSTCARSPLYRKGTDHDLALCKISNPVKGVPYESVNLNPDLIKVGKEILLTGYGCIRAGGGGGNDGIYRIGEAKITREPNPYDLTASGKAALCFGDSGGPAFLYLDDAKTKRVQVSVNSKGDIRTTSYLTVTSSQASIDFLKEWSLANSVKICGVHDDAQGCRDSAPQPPPAPPQPQPEPTCKELYNKLGLCLKDKATWYE